MIGHMDGVLGFGLVARAAAPACARLTQAAARYVAYNRRFAHGTPTVCRTRRLRPRRTRESALRLSEHCMSIIDISEVKPGSHVTLHYRLSLADGAEVINTFNDKPATLSLGTGELSPAVEQRLLGLEEGAHTTFELPAGEAFGERNAEMQQWVARTLLVKIGDPDERYAVGDVVQFPTPDGMGQYAGAVQQVKPGGDAVQFDFNHPLAGQPVVFEVKVIGVL